MSESCDGAPGISSSEEVDEEEVEDDDHEEEEGDSSSIDDVFHTNPILSNPCINTHLLATAPNKLPSTLSDRTKQRRMSEFQCRGVASHGRPSFCRNFNGIRLTAHRRRSEGAYIGVRKPDRPSGGISLTDSYRKPIVISGLTFDFPSPLHAVLSQFDLSGKTRCPMGSAVGTTGYPLQDGSSVSTIGQRKGLGIQGAGLVRHRGKVNRGSESTLLFPSRTRERLAVSESSLLFPQRNRVRLGEIASGQPRGQRLFSKTLKKEDLSEVPATVPSASSNVEESSSEDNHIRESPENERSSSEEKDAEEPIRGLGLPQEAVARPFLSRITLNRLSEEGYFSGSDSQPSTVPEPPPRRRRKGGSCSKESSRACSVENLNELKPEIGSSDFGTVQRETEIETMPSERLRVCANSMF